MPSIKIISFGTLTDGTPVKAVELHNGVVTARIITYGATLQALMAPGRDGTLADIVLGHDDPQGYEASAIYLGATVGRYANRIREGRFRLDGKDYRLAINNGPNALHGGVKGFDKAIWTIGASRADASHAAVTFGHVSPDGDEGYPGNLTVAVTYSLGTDNALTISYAATTDAATVVNLTNHALFNLAGHGTALDAELTLACDAYTPVDETLIPTGELKDVTGTPFDFRAGAVIDDQVRMDDDQIRVGRGFDHNFAVKGGVTTEPKLAVDMVHRASGRGLRILTTEPGIQVYSGNFLDGSIAGKGGRMLRQGDGVAFEAQHYPDSPNQPAFPSTVLRPGEVYRQVTVHQLYVA